MKKVIFTILFLSFCLLLPAQTKERNQIEDKYKWDISHMYKSISDWHKHKEEIKKEIETLDLYKGKLKTNSNNIVKTFLKYETVTKDLYLLSNYANRLADEDLTISENQKMLQEVYTIFTNFSEKISYFSPEINTIDDKTLTKFYNENKELKEFKFAIDEIRRTKKHILSNESESILATAGMIASTPFELYSIFENSEKPNPKVKLSNGEEVVLDIATFLTLRTSDNRTDREIVFREFFNNYAKFKNTFGANILGKVKTDWFFAKSRNYNSTLESSLNSNNIPVTVYENLITQIHNNLPTLHKALNLKKKMLNLENLHYYDLYTPIVKQVDFDFSVEKAAEIIPLSLEPLGKEYVDVVKKAFNERWIDFYPNKGKKSGAYSDGSAYDVHPYILMNWTNDYNSLSTMTHELGHTMHSYFSNKNQRFLYSNYSIFVAEIASTLNENLLNNYMLQNVKSKEEKIFLLGSYLEMLRTTIFRQVSFAEFEWILHKKVEAGEPLTGESISEIYYDIVKKYYGHDLGVCIVDPYIAYEWAFIPHFLMSTYYVYQYSTSLIYSTAIAEKIINQGDKAVKDYYNLLNGGGSDFPIELIKKSGIDPLTSEAFDLTMSKMNQVINEIEKLLSE